MKSEQDVTVREGIKKLCFPNDYLKFLATFILLFGVTLVVNAREIGFDIPSDTADISLTLFAKQAGVTVIVPYEQVRAIQTPALVGNYSLLRGIEFLLRDTALTGKLIGDKLIIKIDNSLQKEATMNPSQSNKIEQSKKGLLAALISVFTVTTGGPVKADDQPRVREEIIVTAQKREVSLQDVPVSVSAITEEAIIKGAIFTFEDYARGVAGLSFSQAGRFSRGGNQAAIRGISQVGVHPVNAFMIDEAPLQPQEFERVGMPDPNMFDVNRVEILRGPQGDIWGSSSMGGVIRVITNKPNADEYEARLAGNLSTISDGGENYEVSGMVNIPIVENKAALRLVAQQMSDGGYVDLVPWQSVDEYLAGGDVSLNKDTNEADVTVFRAALAWQVTDNLRITPSVFYQNIEEDRGRFVATSLFEQTGNLVDVDYGINEFADNEFTNTNLLLEYDFGSGQLTSSTTFFDLEWSNALGAQGISCNFFGACGDPTASLDDIGEEEQIIQEIRYTSNLDGPINFIVGAFYRDVEDTFAQFSTSEILIPVVGTNLVFSKEGEVEKVEEKAVFGQFTWQFAEALELSVGARWYDYERDRLTPDTFGLFGFSERNTSAEEDGILPTVALRYTPNEDVMIYGRYAEGFRPGFGFATVFPPPCDSELERLGIDPDGGVGQVSPDSVETFELGAKTSWLENRVTVNATVYHTDWKDIHARIGLNCGFALDQNAGAADVDGAELEIQALVGDALDLNLSIGYTDATFAEDVPAIGAVNGNQIPEVPEWTIGVMAQYNFIALGGDAYVRANYSYTDEALLAVAVTSPLDALGKPSVDLLGLRFGVDYQDWQFALYAKNALNADESDLCARENTFRNSRPETSTCVLKPRELGIYLSKNFN